MRNKQTPVIIVDTREQRPWQFSPQAVVARGTVPSGADYTVLGFESVIGIERKSLADLVGSLTVGRGRFVRSVRRLLRRRFRLLIVESPLSYLEDGTYRSHVAPSAMVGSVCKLMAIGVPVLFVSDHRQAARVAERWLRIAWSCAREADEVATAEWVEAEPVRSEIVFAGKRRRGAAA